MKKLLFIIVLLALTGCFGLVTKETALGRLTIDDAKAASALAAASNDAAAVRCYDFISNSINSAPGFTPGLLYLNEMKRTAAANGQALASACGGVLQIVIAP